MDIMLTMKLIAKLAVSLRSKTHRPSEEDKLLSSPKKSSGEYKRALIELKSYVRFLS